MQMRQYSFTLKNKFYRDEEHPYRIFEQEILKMIKPHYTVLDAGCGRSGEMIKSLSSTVEKAIGVDLVDFSPELRSSKVKLLNNDLSKIDLPDGSVDMVISRSVFEHFEEPLSVYLEMHRILRPAGKLFILTPNLLDYSSLISKLIPNKFHAQIVKKTEGRNEFDTFPTHYKSNTFASIRRLAHTSEFDILSIRYLGQYPNYLIFNPVAFLIGTFYDKLLMHLPPLKILRSWLMVLLSRY
jgi:ubiquinone/menaquinone biosynthesis C-methylase UbiE